jgi:hypothetical protein
MHTFHGPIAGLIAAALAAYGLWQFLRHLQRDRVVADTPLAHIRSAAQGYVKVRGRALCEGAAATQAPLTHRDCVWWRYAIAREERGPKGETRWVPVEDGASVEPFLLDEDGARCLVGPVRAEITPTDKKVWRDGDLRYTEAVLEVGAQLCVLGELRSHSEVGDVNAATTEKLHEWKQDQQALLARFDTNHDGRLDATEWEAVRAAAAKEAGAQNLSSDIVRTSIISQPTNGEPFLIAPLDTRQLENRERIYAGIYLVLALIGLYGCGYALTHH